MGCDYSIYHSPETHHVLYMYHKLYAIALDIMLYIPNKIYIVHHRVTP